MKKLNIGETYHPLGEFQIEPGKRITVVNRGPLDAIFHLNDGPCNLNVFSLPAQTLAQIINESDEICVMFIVAEEADKGLVKETIAGLAAFEGETTMQQVWDNVPEFAERSEMWEYHYNREICQVVHTRNVTMKEAK